MTNPETPFGNTETPVDPVKYWVMRSAWPKKYLKSGSMDQSGSLAASSTTPSDQKPRDEKGASYQDPRHKTLLKTKGSYTNKDGEGPRIESNTLCQNLLAEDQYVPPTSRFSNSVFKSTCMGIDGRNEAKVIQDISRLIVPLAEELADFGADNLTCLVEAALSEEQRKKLAPFIEDFIAGDQSYFMATYYMYFPFLTCEVKCGAAALDIADRQNAHSMTLAVRAVVELFRLAGREKEADREILAFSVSHDHRSVRTYGHYAVVDGSNATSYRHPIHTFDFTAFHGKEKWTAYKFTKSIHDRWMPTHFARLCSVIGSLPVGVDFDVPPL
ncbi:hypothetical protein GQ44DRAFT_832556 [Phaeosphaeriaceae sp. PMI808]|nr:hypothetical protein GQ44DRAFT_832556 [Phaeosphaeriaceae sp. PMI808]